MPSPRPSRACGSRPGRRRATRSATPDLPTTGPQAIVVVRDEDGRLRDLSWTPQEDIDVEPVAADTEDGRSVIRHSAAHVLAQAVQQAFPDAKLGIGPPIRDGFYYDFDVDETVHARRSHRPRQADAQDHQVGPAVLAPSRRLRRRRAGGTRGRALQAGAGRHQERRVGRERRRRRECRGRRRRADHLRQPARAHRGAGLGRPVPRSARADHPVHPRVPAHPDRRRVLAGQRQEPAAAAHLRHRVGVGGGPGATTSSCSPRPSAATTAGSVPSSTCSRFPTRSAPAWRFSTRGRHHPQGARGLLPAAAHRGGLLVRQHPAHQQGGAVPDLRAPRLVRGRHVPADAPRSGAATTTARCANPARTTTSSR